MGRSSGLDPTAHALGKTEVGSILPVNRNADYGYFELTYKGSKSMGKAPAY